MLMDAVGVAAGIAVIAAFYSVRARRMRGWAIASNLCFVAYGAAGGLWPVMTLHAVLLPLNLVRLVQMRRPPGLCPRTRRAPPPPRAPRSRPSAVGGRVSVERRLPDAPCDIPAFCPAAARL